MSCYLILVTLFNYLLITSSFTSVQTANLNTKIDISDSNDTTDLSDRSVGLKRRRYSKDFVQALASAGRARTDSDLTFTTAEKFTPSTASSEFQLGIMSIDSNQSLLTADENDFADRAGPNVKPVLESVINVGDEKLDNFAFDIDTTLCDPKYSSVALLSAPSETVPHSIFDGPFRADFMRKTVILNHETSPISLEEFQDHFLNLCETNLIFQTASVHKSEHYFIGSELNLVVDADSEVPNALCDISVTSVADTADKEPVASIPLHPIFVLAREILVYAVVKGKIEILREAMAAGMNFNFDILFKPTGLRMNLLHFVCGFSAYSSTEVVKFLIEEVGFDPNQADSHGFAPLHLVAFRDNFKIAEALLISGADPNLYTSRSDYSAAIHIAAKWKSYYFLKPFIYLKGVKINLIDSNGNHLIHLALKNKSFSCFSDLLKHSKILLEFQVVRSAFKLIRDLIPIEDDRFYDVLIDHVLKRSGAHESHLHFITYYLLLNENISALKIFLSKGFDFSFIHLGQFGRPPSTPLTVSVRHDCLESFKFLISIGISLTENLVIPEINHVLCLAIHRNAILIVKHLLDTLEFDVLVVVDCLKSILKTDNSTIFKVFLDKIGQEIWTQIEEIDPETNPNIFLLKADSNLK